MPGVSGRLLAVTTTGNVWKNVGILSFYSFEKGAFLDDSWELICAACCHMAHVKSSQYTVIIPHRVIQQTTKAH